MEENFNSEDFKKAVKNLHDILGKEKTAEMRDASIKRFELAYDLCWKFIKNEAKSHGVECYTPRQCFKAAFQLKLADQDKTWIDMIEDRNSAVHTYKEALADALYKKLPEYLKLFEDLKEKIK